MPVTVTCLCTALMLFEFQGVEHLLTEIIVHHAVKSGNPEGKPLAVAARLPLLTIAKNRDRRQLKAMAACGTTCKESQHRMFLLSSQLCSHDSKDGR
jgi:hypothetical protein